jgi:hypothetical protein
MNKFTKTMMHFKRFIFVLLVASMHFFASAQSCSIEGVITDSLTNEKLIGAHVIVQNLKIGATTNENGYYSLTFPCGQTILKISMIGYSEKEIILYISKKTELNIQLNQIAIQVNEVVVEGHRAEQNVKSAAMGTIELNLKSIQSMPTLAGERDLMRMLQLTPGVAKSETSSGLNIRGGAGDQNLILLDGATVYNPMHLAGFFSVFNPMSVNKVKLIKSGIPANYGGRLSSVIDIETLRGNNKKLEGSANIGLISSSLWLTGPIVKDKAAFTFSVRKTYIDELVKPAVGLFLKNSIFNSIQYGFYDINSGLSYDISTKDRLYLSVYYGRDNFYLHRTNFDFTNKMEWGNTAASLQWNHFGGGVLSITNAVTYSNYNFNFNLIALDSALNFTVKSLINDIGYTSDYSFYFDKHTFKTGIQLNNLRVLPNSSQVTNEDLEADMGTPNHFNIYWLALYANDEYNLTDKIKINAGIRLLYHLHCGPYNLFKRDNSNEIIDTVQYTTNEIVARYFLPEPRLSIRYLFNENSSIKASYTENYQSLQQVNITSISMPTDFWIPATTNIKPQKGSQVSLGYYQNLSNNQYETSVECYYKDMKNQMEFKNGLINIIRKETLEENLIFGKGWSYGAEFYLKKNSGIITGWISYTLSRSMRQFDTINGGIPYPAKYDRTHDISLLLNYNFNSKWTFSAVFIYSTGNAFTLPQDRRFLQENIINGYGAYNSFRMPAYHRLDISATRTLKKRGRFESSLNFSIINVYNRQNPFYIYIDVDQTENSSLTVKPKQVSIFPFLPSISWQLKF